MTDKPITLAGIAESEKICEAFNEKIEAGFEGLEMDGVDAIKLIGGFSHHARTRLPEMNKLCREMLPFVEDWILEPCIERMPKETRDDCGKCTSCKARRRGERMEQKNVD